MIGLSRRSFTAVLALALALVLVPASAGASAAPPPVALTATPARVQLAGGGRTIVRVTNSGMKRVAVDVSRAGFALDLRGRPRIVPSGGARSAAAWLTLRPPHFTIGPRTSVSLVVTAKLPRRAEPGDHDALALLRTRPIGEGRVAVRLRLGVVVVVRAPGTIVRRLELDGLHVARRGRQRVLELDLVNRGNVTESLDGARAVISRRNSGRPVVTAFANSREVRPRTRGLLTFRCGRGLHGWFTAHVVIPPDGVRGRLERTYRIRM
jgi:hypothetical protein